MSFSLSRSFCNTGNVLGTEKNPLEKTDDVYEKIWIGLCFCDCFFIGNFNPVQLHASNGEDWHTQNILYVSLHFFWPNSTC